MMIVKRVSKAARWTSLVLGLSVTLLMGLPAQAFHFPWDQGHDTTDWDDPNDPGPCEGPNCDPCTSTGSPVYIPTGHFIWSDTDVAMPGRPGLSLTRTYNSHDPRDGAFGNGWSSGCEFGLFKNIASVADSNGTAVDQTEYLLRFPNGKRYTFVEQDDGSIASPAGRFEQASANSDGSFSLTDRGGYQMIFNANGSISQRVDPYGIRLNYDYDSNGQLNRLSDNNGRFIALSYNASGRVVAVTDHTGRNWLYSYDSNGNLVSVTNPLGGVRRYEYSAYTPIGDNHTYYQLTRIVDESGVEVTVVTYNGERVQSYTVGANRFTYSFNTTTNTVTKTDSLNSRWTYVYDDEGLPIRVTDPLGNTEQYEHDANGQVARYVDQTGAVWLATYDDLGRKTSQTNPLGEARTWSYNGDNPQPTRTVSPSGRVTTVAYNAAGFPTQITDPEGASSFLSWDSAGNPTATRDALGNTTSVSTNSLGLPAVITDALGQVSRFTYDARGNIASMENPNGDAIGYEYDALNRPVRTTDQVGRVTEYVYDAIGRLLTLTDPAGNITRYTYDNFGRLQTRTDAVDRVFQYGYRTDNLLSQVIRPDNTVTTYSYDAAKRKTLANIAGASTTYSYTPRHELASAVNDTGTVTLRYDAAGRIIEETVNGQTVTSAYNSDGERIQMGVLGLNVDYSRNANGLVTQMATPLGDYTLGYDELGRRTQLTMPNGSQVDYGYSVLSQVNSIDHSGAYNANYNYSYTTDSLVSDWVGDGADWSFQYDPSGELTQAVNGGVSYDYNSDQAGNLLGDGRNYDAANRLLEGNTYTFSYDPRGNLTEKRHKTTGARVSYQWNTRNQLVRVERYVNGTATTPDSAVDYSYGPLERRWTRIENGQVERYVYDGDDRVATLDGADNSVMQVVFGPDIDEPLGMSSNQGERFFHADYLGSIVALTDDTNVTSRYSYDPYGATVNSNGSDPNPFRYTAREYEADDLYYYRARYYDPTVQRFLSEDPIGFTGGDLNLYRYVGNNPINYTDPSGKIVWFAVAWAAIEIGLAVYDAYDTASTIFDPCASGWEKALAGGLFIGGALLPGGGYSKIDDAARYVDDAARRVDDIARRAPCGCFTAGTDVLTDEGLKPIETVEVGDQLLSKDEESGELAWNPVSRRYQFNERELYQLDVARADGTQSNLTVTDDHPFWVKDQGWVASAKLQAGMQLQDRQGQWHEVIGWSALEHRGTTFNFEVADDHTFFVGEEGFWVHNGGPCDIKTYQTYTKANPTTGDVYTGRTSGTGTPEQNIARRDQGHHMNEQGYGPATLDQSSTNKDVIRGREQQVIDHHGGAQSQGGTSGNAINGVSPTNPRRQQYLDAAAQEFGAP